ncbi:hypothetical protein MHBO_002456 [Bonamia ostreae]|uniref:Sushi domain-containing protein n=1 Tax=Bonamia ostreae TaxID=126728 RepID=A0ABV2AMD4_9EUKA
MAFSNFIIQSILIYAKITNSQFCLNSLGSSSRNTFQVENDCSGSLLCTEYCVPGFKRKGGSYQRKCDTSTNLWAGAPLVCELKECSIWTPSEEFENMRIMDLKCIENGVCQLGCKKGYSKKAGNDVMECVLDVKDNNPFRKWSFTNSTGNFKCGF